jgi:hypothetical protein
MFPPLSYCKEFLYHEFCEKSNMQLYDKNCWMIIWFERERTKYVISNFPFKDNDIIIISFMYWSTFYINIWSYDLASNSRYFFLHNIRYFYLFIFNLITEKNNTSMINLLQTHNLNNEKCNLAKRILEDSHSFEYYIIVSYNYEFQITRLVFL